jgi:hypothetical protein
MARHNRSHSTKRRHKKAKGGARKPKGYVPPDADVKKCFKGYYPRVCTEARCKTSCDKGTRFSLHVPWKDTKGHCTRSKSKFFKTPKWWASARKAFLKRHPGNKELVTNEAFRLLAGHNRPAYKAFKKDWGPKMVTPIKK